MSKANGHAPPDPLDELDDVIAELEGTEWDDDEITAEHYIHAEPGANVTVVTGKHAAMSKDQADEITLTDHGQPPRKEQQSEPPRSGVSGAISAVGSAASKINTWPAAVAVVAFVAGVVAYLLLRP